MMTAFHATTVVAERIRPVIGFAAAVGAAVLLFSSGLAAMDYVQMAEQNRVLVRTGSFAPERQSDYAPVTSPRLPAQRPAR